MSVVDRMDRYQRGHAWVALPLAVVYKLYEDRGPHRAALITYYGFVSLFPLLLVFLSIVGFFAGPHGSVHDQLVRSVLRNFPIIGGQLGKNISTFHGSGIALVVGVLGSIYGGLGAVLAAQTTFNRVYGVPRHEQPDPIASRLRGLLLLTVLGTFAAASTGLAALVSTGNQLGRQFGPAVTAGAYLLTLVVDIGLFTVAFQILTARDLRVRHVLAGGVLAGVSWMVLQTIGTSYIAHRFHHANHVYGTFGVVLAALAWIYLESIVLVIAAEVNVVLNHHLYPRALLSLFSDDVDLTDADRRCYEMYTLTQRMKSFQRITNSFDKDTDSPAGPPDGYLEPGEHDPLVRVRKRNAGP